MAAELAYGIIGCGMMGQEHLRNLALVEGARVAAVCDPDPAQRAAGAALAPGAAAYDRLEAMLAAPGLDALVLASPNYLHVDQFEAIADIRPLPLLLEKPAYADPADASRLAVLGGRYPAPVWVAMEYRYMPAIAALVAEAEAATGGVAMLSLREHRMPFLDKIGQWNRFNRLSGGTLVEKCCHFFDLMRLVTGAEPVRVMASGAQVSNHRDERHGGARPDIWDSAYVIVDFAGGARAMLELCMFAEGGRWQEEIAATGPAGKIEAFVPGPTRFWPAQLGPPPVAEVVASPRAPRGPVRRELPVDPALLAAGDHNGATFHQHLRFLRAARGEGEVEVTLADGMAAVRMGHAAQHSAATGEAVALAARLAHVADDRPDVAAVSDAASALREDLP